VTDDQRPQLSLVKADDPVSITTARDRRRHPRGAELGPHVRDAGIVEDAELAEDQPVAVNPTAVLAAQPIPREVIPAWARDRRNVRDFAREVSRNAARTTAFHALRLPRYWLLLALRSHIGVWRCAVVAAKWVFDDEGRSVRRSLSSGSPGTPEAAAFHKVTDQHGERVKVRLCVAALAAAVSAFAAFRVHSEWPWPSQALLGAFLLAVLGGIGRKKDQLIVSSSVVAHEAPRITDQLILTALGSLGIGELNKNLRQGDEAVRFVGPIHRDGPGWRADLDLPPGVTATQVIDKREELASGLRRPLGCVWPERDSDQHPGRLVLWVGDKTLGRGYKIPWSLAKPGAKVSLFEPFPIGEDQRGRPATLTLMYANMIVGALPGMGKTFTVRLALLAAALDVTARILAFELKGSGDWSCMENVADAYCTGDDDRAIDYVMESLRSVHKDMPRRYETIRSLPREECPENKVTPQLAARRDLELHPVVIAIDECQFLFTHERYGKEATKIITDLIKRGRAVGIICIVATQRVDKDSIPTSISSNAVLRFCLKVTGQVENDMVLGTSVYKAGYRATMFDRNEQGVGYLAGEGDEPIIVKAAFLDNPASEIITKRARAARIAAGRLTGYAAGIEPERDDDDSRTALDDLAEVMADDKERSEDLCARLADLRPDVYAGWGPKDLSGAVAPFGVKTVQVGRRVEGKYTNRAGLERAHVMAALDRLDERRDR